MSDHSSEPSAGPIREDPPVPPAQVAPSPGDGSALTAAPSRRAVFAVEGRATPGLYALGWIASGLGLAMLVVAVASASTGLGGLGLTLAAMVLLSLGLVAAAGAQGAQRRADGVTGYHGPSPFLVFAASLPLTVLLVLVVVGSASAAGLDALSPAGALVQVLLTAIVYAGLVRLLVVGPGALSWAEMGLRRLPAAPMLLDLAWGASFALPVVFVTAILAAALVGGLNTTPEGPLPPSVTTEGFLLNLISAAIIAPIGEEIFYRGFALTAWARTLAVRSAILRSALFFAFVHILTVGADSFSEGAAQALIAFVVRLPVALALAWVFLRRWSLYAAIGLHAGFNGILLLIAQAAANANP